MSTKKTAASPGSPAGPGTSAPLGHPLGEFDGEPEVAAALKLKNTGSDLTNPLRVAPRAFQRGDMVHIVLEGEVERIEHRAADPKEPDDGLCRVHNIRIDTAVLVPEAWVEAWLEAQRDAVRRAREIDGQVSIYDHDDEKWDEADDEAPL